MLEERKNKEIYMFNQPTQPKKLKILYYGDSPTVATGFGTVAGNILTGLHATGKYEIDIFGVNYWGDPKPPYTKMFNIYPAGMNNERDPYGRKKFMEMAKNMDFDILFFLQDSFILEFLKDYIPKLKAEGKKFVSVCYYPCDSIIKKPWAEAVAAVDILVAYTGFAKNETLKSLDKKRDIRVIYHGVNQYDFYPRQDEEAVEFRKRYFGPQADKFIFINLNRNQQRKDIPRFIRAFKEVKKTNPNVLAYCHMAIKDQGWNLDEVCNNLGLSMKTDVIFPQNFGPNQGYPIQVVNVLYNACDCVISTDLGEGFGLSWIEGMATKTPVISPNNTVRPELISDDIAYLVDSGTNENLYTILPNDNEVLRPLVDIDHLAKTMRHVVDNPEEAKEKAEVAYKHVMENFTWEHSIVPQWTKLFEEAGRLLNTEVQLDTKNIFNPVSI
jgi:glycosyltransferase involved in cell wall biosynthesis